MIRQTFTVILEHDDDPHDECLESMTLLTRKRLFSMVSAEINKIPSYDILKIEVTGD